MFFVEDRDILFKYQVNLKVALIPILFPMLAPSPLFCCKSSIWHLGMSPKIKSISKQGSHYVPSPQAGTRLAPKTLKNTILKCWSNFITRKLTTLKGLSSLRAVFWKLGRRWGRSCFNRGDNWKDLQGGICWVVLGKCGRHTLIAHCLYSVWRGCFQSQYRANHLRPSLCLSVEWPID